MKTFRDALGREWSIAVNVTVLKRIKAVTDVDLAPSLDDPVFLERLVNDPVLMCDIIFAVCQPDAEKRGISDEQFGEGMAGDPMDDAWLALTEALVEFFPGRAGKVQAKKLEKIRQAENLALENQYRMLTDPSLDEKLRRAISGETYIKSPDI